MPNNFQNPFLAASYGARLDAEVRRMADDQIEYDIRHFNSELHRSNLSMQDRAEVSNYLDLLYREQALRRMPAGVTPLIATLERLESREADLQRQASQGNNSMFLHIELDRVRSQISELRVHIAETQVNNIQSLPRTAELTPSNITYFFDATNNEYIVTFNTESEFLPQEPMTIVGDLPYEVKPWFEITPEGGIRYLQHVLPAIIYDTRRGQGLGSIKQALLKELCRKIGYGVSPKDDSAVLNYLNRSRLYQGHGPQERIDISARLLARHINETVNTAYGRLG